MKAIVCKKKPQSDSLQNQENNNRKKTPDEEEYITHLYKEHGTRNKIQDQTFAKDLSPVETLVSCSLSLVPFLLSHYKWIPVIMFQSNTRTTNHTFQRIIGNMHGKFNFLA